MGVQMLLKTSGPFCPDYLRLKYQLTYYWIESNEVTGRWETSNLLLRSGFMDLFSTARVPPLVLSHSSSSQLMMSAPEVRRVNGCQTEYLVVYSPKSVVYDCITKDQLVKWKKKKKNHQKHDLEQWRQNFNPCFPLFDAAELKAANTFTLILTGNLVFLVAVWLQQLIGRVKL